MKFQTIVRLVTFVWSALVLFAQTPEGASMVDSLIQDLTDDGQLNNSNQTSSAPASTVAQSETGETVQTAQKTGRVIRTPKNG